MPATPLLLHPDVNLEAGLSNQSSVASARRSTAHPAQLRSSTRNNKLGLLISFATLLASCAALYVLMLGSQLWISASAGQRVGPSLNIKLSMAQSVAKLLPLNLLAEPPLNLSESTPAVEQDFLLQSTAGLSEPAPLLQSTAGLSEPAPQQQQMDAYQSSADATAQSALAATPTQLLNASNTTSQQELFQEQQQIQQLDLLQKLQDLANNVSTQYQSLEDEAEAVEELSPLLPLPITVSGQLTTVALDKSKLQQTEDQLPVPSKLQPDVTQMKPLIQQAAATTSELLRAGSDVESDPPELEPANLGLILADSPEQVQDLTR